MMQLIRPKIKTFGMFVDLSLIFLFESVHATKFGGTGIVSHRRALKIVENVSCRKIFDNIQRKTKFTLRSC